jgi:hypothetical protein
MNRQLQIARLWVNWSRIFGENVSGMARPLGTRKRTLVIGAQDAVALQELSFYSEEILDRIRDFLGWQPFDKVSFELLQSKIPLDEVRVQHSYRRPSLPDRSDLKQAEDEPDRGSVVDSCYRAYVEMVKEKKKSRQ